MTLLDLVTAGAAVDLGRRRSRPSAPAAGQPQPPVLVPPQHWWFGATVERPIPPVPTAAGRPRGAQPGSIWSRPVPSRTSTPTRALVAKEA